MQNIILKIVTGNLSSNLVLFANQSGWYNMTFAKLTEVECISSYIECERAQQVLIH